MAAFEVQERGHFFGQAVGMDVVPLEFHTGVFAVADQFSQFGFQHLLPQNSCMAHADGLGAFNATCPVCHHSAFTGQSQGPLPGLFQLPIQARKKLQTTHHRCYSNTYVNVLTFWMLSAITIALDCIDENVCIFGCALGF